MRALWRKTKPWKVTSFTGDFALPSKFDEVAQADHFHFRGGGIEDAVGNEVEDLRLRVVEPFAGGIEFLEDVFHHAEVLVHAHLAVVLPATLVGDFAVGILAGDAVVVAAPAGGVHGVDVAAGGIRPLRGALVRKGVGSEALPGSGGLAGVEVRIAGHPLAGAIDEELVDGEAGRGGGGPDAGGPVVLPGKPAAEIDAAAEDRLSFVLRLIDDGEFRRARVRGLQDEGLGQVVDAVFDPHRDRFLSSERPGGIAGGGQGAEGRGHGAWVRVLAGDRDVKIRGVEGGQEGERKEQAGKIHGKSWVG